MSKNYDDLSVLCDLNFSLSDGAVLVIHGKNGAGKSTLMRCLSHIETPSSGEVRIDDKAYCDKLHAPLVQHLDSGDRGYLDELSIIENLKLFSGIESMSKAVFESQVASLSESLPLKEILGRKASELSRGNLQIYKVARSLLSPRVKYYFWDEPLAHLDNERRQAVIDLIEKMSQKGRVFVISSQSHIIQSLPFKNKLCIQGGCLK